MPQGSAGDVHPFVGIGLELQRRGHHVTLATNGHFRGLAGKVGLSFYEIGSAEHFDEVTQNPDLWKPSIKSTKVVFGMSAQVIPQQVRLIQERWEQDKRLIVVAGPLAFGARLISQTLPIKHVTVQLAPAVFPSVEHPPKLPGLYLPDWSPRWYRKWVWAMALAITDALLIPKIRKYAREVACGIPDGHLMHWWNSPQLTLAMFPDWFASRASDWPNYVKLCGFGLYDEATDDVLSPQIKTFLDAGPKPVVFTPGSANVHAADFFKTSLEVCKRSGRRGIFLTRYADQIPTHLPQSVEHFDYVPLSKLLPHCSALVYHGGIGTLSQACKAGIPHLVMKLAHDQFDNAHRLEQLGVGLSCKPRGYTVNTVKDMLDQLIDRPKVLARCKELAVEMQSDNGIGKACDMIEKLNANLETTSQI